MAPRTIADPAEEVARRALSDFGIDGEVVLRFVNRRENVVFRVTGGATAKLTYPASGKSTFEVGPAFPIYINTNLMPDEKGIFKGIVRLTPRIVYTRDDDGDTAWQFLVALELLTGRSMFPMASDLL